MKKSFIILTLFLISWSFSAIAASPVIYFSDLTDGPTSGWEGSSTKGAAVTIWGLNFGTLRGTSYITCGGINLMNNGDYAEWGTGRGLRRPAGLDQAAERGGRGGVVGGELQSATQP